MVQEIKVTTSDGTEYTFESTTDNTTITISDDMFAEILTIEELKKSVERLRHAVTSGAK